MYQFRFRMEYIYICSSSKMNVTWMFLKAVVIWVCLCNQNPVRFFSKFQLQFEVSKSRKRGRGRRVVGKTSLLHWENIGNLILKHFFRRPMAFSLAHNCLRCFLDWLGWMVFVVRKNHFFLLQHKQMKASRISTHSPPKKNHVVKNCEFPKNLAFSLTEFLKREICPQSSILK